MKKLTAETVRGLKWTYAAAAANMVLQVLLTAALARLLAPDAFGLVAMCYTVVKFGTYFAQLGIAPALIRHRTLTNLLVDTAFVTSIIASLCLFAAIWLAAPAFEIMFDDSRVVPLVHIAAWAFLTGSVGVVAQALLRRNMRFGTVGAIEIVSILLGPLAVGLPLALHGFGAYSLVWGFVIQSAVLSALAYAMCGHNFRLRFDQQAFRELFSFGGKQSLISFLEFLTYILDVFMIAQFLGAKALGLYNRATYLIQIPAQTLNNAVAKVAYPALSAANTEDSRFRGAFLTTFLLIGMVLFPVCFGMSAAAAELVEVVLGGQWLDAAPILQLLAIAVPFHLMLHVHGLAFDVKASLNIKILIRLAHLTIMAMLYLSLARFGLVGFAVAFLIAEVGFYFLYAAAAMRMLEIRSGDFIGCHGTLFSTALAAGLAIFVVSAVLRHFGAAPAAILPVQIAAGAVVLALRVVVFPAPRFSADLALRLETGYLPGVRRSGLPYRFLGWYLGRLKHRALAVYAQPHSPPVS